MEAAIAAYDLLSPEAKAKLTAEKALLDSLLAEIEDQEEQEQDQVQDPVLEVPVHPVRARRAEGHQRVPQRRRR